MSDEDRMRRRARELAIRLFGSDWQGPHYGAILDAFRKTAALALEDAVVIANEHLAMARAHPDYAASQVELLRNDLVKRAAAERKGEK